MGLRRSRTGRKRPSEKQKPFFDKQSTERSAFFPANSVQRQLRVGKANDPAEKEAESAAHKVMQVQKAEKKEEEPVQKAEKKEDEKVSKAEKKEEEKPVQKAEKKEEEPVQKAEKKEDEKVSKAEKKEEEKPVQKAEKKEEEQVQKAEKKEDEKVSKAEKTEEEKPVQKAEKKEEEPVQKAEKKEDEKVSKAEKKEEEKPVQAKTDPRLQKAPTTEAAGESEMATSSFEGRLAKRKGMGFTLPDELRRDMEGKFRTSFKDVRIHTDKEAAEMCEAIHALAFAHGYDIYFNEGMYNPEALSGRELLAHELAHVVQQNG